jgi:hypothetical protein
MSEKKAENGPNHKLITESGSRRRGGLVRGRAKEELIDYYGLAKKLSAKAADAKALANLIAEDIRRQELKQFSEMLEKNSLAPVHMGIDKFGEAAFKKGFAEAYKNNRKKYEELGFEPGQVTQIFKDYYKNEMKKNK